MYSPYNKASRSPYTKGPRINEDSPLKEHALQIPAFGAVSQEAPKVNVEEDSVEGYDVVRPLVMSQFLERTAFYGLQASMVLYLTKYLSMKSGDADGKIIHQFFYCVISVYILCIQQYMYIAYYIYVIVN